MSIKITTTGQTTFVKKVEIGVPIKSVQQAASGTVNGEGRTTGNILVLDSATNLFVPADILGGNGISVSHDKTTNDITINQDSSADITVDDLTITGKITGNLIPSVDSNYTLGTPTFKWKELYVSQGSVHIGTVVLSDSGGQLKIQDSDGIDAKVSLAANTTDDLAEGSTNEYFTTARANTAIDARVTGTFISNLSSVDADTVGSFTAAQLLNYQLHTNTPTIPALYTDFVDSGETSKIITADVTSTFFNNLSGTDADNLGGQAGSYYLNYSNFTNTPTIPTFGGDFIDSAAASAIITADVTSTFFNNLSGTDADNLGGQAGSYYLNYNNFTNTPSIPSLGNDFVDSGQVTNIVDAAYVQARQSDPGLDSALAVQLIDTAHVQARADSSYIKTVNFNNDEKLLFGTGLNLEIVHEAGGNSVIKETGSGELRLQGSKLLLANPDASTVLAEAGTSDGVKLYDSSGTLRLHTHDYGVSTHGTLTGDSATFTNIEASTELKIGGVVIDSDWVKTIDGVGGGTDSATVVSIIDSAHVKLHAQTPDFFDFTGAKPGHREGRLFYDSANGALGMYNDEADITLQIGQESYIRVYNQSGATITNGTPVYIVSSFSGFPTIEEADASDAAKYEVVGLATHEIENNSYGYVTTRGFVNDLDTANLTVGNRFHLGFSSPGTFTETAPTYPNFPVDLGTVLVSDSNTGSVYVNVIDHAAETFRSTGDVRFDGNLTVGGNFTVLGTEVVTQVASLEVAENFIKVGEGDTIVTSYTGSGLNDGNYKNHYQGDSSVNYYVRIKSTDPAGDKIEWAFDSGFATLLGFDSAGGPTEHDLGTDKSLIALRHNIAITFDAATGHTVGDRWFGPAAPQNEQLGIIGNYNTPTEPYSRAGLFRDTADGRFKFFDGYTQSISASINTADASFTNAPIQFSTGYGNLVGNVTGNVTGTVSDLSNHNTDSLPEGSTNLYHTTARVEAIVDSAYIASRTLGSVDSAGVSSIITTDVDSSYIAARIGGPFVDSAYVTSQIPASIDSANVSSIITADVTQSFVNNLDVDAATLGGRDSSYLLDYNNHTNTPTIPTFGTDFVDSSAVSTIITADVDKAFVDALGVDADFLGGQDSNYYLNYNNFTNTPTIPTLGTDFVDSGQVSSIITADVDKAFVDALGINADFLGGRDSSYLLNYNNFTNTPTIPSYGTDYIDSDGVLTLIDSDYVGNRATASFTIEFLNRAGAVASSEQTTLKEHVLNGLLSVDHEITLLAQDSSDVTVIL